VIAPFHKTSMMRYVLWRILPIVIPVLLAAFIATYEFTYHTIEDQQAKAIEAELSFAQKTLDTRIQTTERWLKNLAANGMVINSLVDPRGAGEYIPQLIKSLRVPGPTGQGHIELLDFQGKVIASNNIETSLSVDHSWLQGVLNGTSYESITHDGLIMAEPVVINGLPEGALVLLLDSEALSGFVAVSSASGFISVIDTHDHVLFSSPGQDYFPVGELYKEDELLNWIISKKPIYGSSDLFVIFKQKNTIAFQAVADVQYALIVFIVIAITGIILSLSISGRIMTRALGSVAGQMRALRTEKDLSKRIDVSHVKELADLENSYNEMAEELENTTVSKGYIDELFDGLPLPVFVTDVTGKITRTNQPTLSAFKSDDLPLPEYFHDLIVQTDIEKHEKELVTHFAYRPKSLSDAFFYLPKKHGSYEMEMWLKRQDSEAKPYILSITSLKDYVGTLTGFIITATDITERKQQEKEILDLAEQNTLMARAIEEIDLGVTISDGRQMHQPLIFCNQAFLDLSGRPMEDIIGFSCSFMQGPETDPNTIKALSQAIYEQKAITVEILNYKHDGESFWNELSLNPIFSNDGSLKYYVGIQRDVSERKRIEAMKKEFISTVSHELRTPLTSIHGALGLINDLHAYDDEDSEEKELLSVAYRNSERLKFLVDDILDTEKLEAGEMRFFPEFHELNDIMEQGVQLNSSYGEQYGVEFLITDTLPDIYICVDKQRITQVFANLLSNAAKFSKDLKRVDIGAKILNTSRDKVRITVRDYGDGISEEFQKQIFSKFAQADSSDVRKLPGTGLGLYITKKIIEAHDGEISFTTQPGEGTTFYIDLPCRIGAE